MTITIDLTVLKYVILRVISLVIGLRVDQQDEIERLDLSQHGERGYHSNWLLSPDVNGISGCRF